MFAPEAIQHHIGLWLRQLFSDGRSRVSILFSVAQANVGSQPFGSGDLQQIRDKLNLKFKNNVRYIGVAHFYIMPLHSELQEALDDLIYLQDRLKLSFHIGVGVPTKDSGYALESAHDAWTASLRLNANGALVNFSQFFSREEISRFIVGNGDDRFLLHFQPKICGETCNIVGYEALARLHYCGNELPPGDNNDRSCNFLQAVSANGLQREFDYWLINQVAPLVNNKQSISINLLASALTEELADLIFDTINNVVLGYLDVEILEHEAMTKETLRIVSDLNAKGVSFSLDDFGKGVSNIDLLHQLPHGSTIKVDFSFVRGSHLDDDAANRKRQTQRAIANLAKIYNHNIVFEGVECEEIFANLIMLIEELEISAAKVKYQGYFRDGMPKPWESFNYSLVAR